MSDTLSLPAETRDRAGKGASRALRREGRVPAVIYGNKQDPAGISLNERELVKLLNTGHFMNSVVMIDAGGKPVRTLPKDVAFDVVTDRPLHVDFLRIGEHTTVTVNVPVVFTDESSGGTPTAWSWDFGDGTPVVGQRNRYAVGRERNAADVRRELVETAGAGDGQRGLLSPVPGREPAPSAPHACPREQHRATPGRQRVP